MKYIVDMPMPASGAETGLEVKALAGIRRVKPVGARTLPPLVVQPHKALQDALVDEEVPHNQRVHKERRTYCRRIEHLPVLIELRSAIVRRRHNQRAGDLTEHVDIKV